MLPQKAAVNKSGLRPAVDFRRQFLKSCGSREPRYSTVESHDSTVPAFSSGVGFVGSAWCSTAGPECLASGEACTMAIRHAIKSTVRGEGDGIGEEGPTR